MQVDELDITTRLVYGTSNPGSDPNTHIRDDAAGSAPPDVIYSMADYLKTGAGRYALPSSAGIINAFFSDGILPFSKLADRETPYTLAEVRSILGVSGAGNADLRFSVSQYTTDVLSSDYLERSYVFGSTSFTLADDLTFSVVDGKYSVNNLEVRAFDDNFDFESSSLIASLANPLLRASFDPYGLIPVVNGNTLPVDIRFTGAGREYESYSTRDYLLDSAATIAATATTAAAVPVIEAALAGLATNTGYLGSINGNNLFRYYTDDGKKIIYGTNEADTIGVLSAELTADIYLTYQMVGGAGNDQIKAGGFVDELWGGDGDDKLEGSGGNDELIGGAGTDTAIYLGSCLDYNLSKAADGTVTISHVRGSKTDGVDTLTGVEKAQFSDHVIDLTLPVLVGCTELSFVNDFVVGTTQDTRVIFNLERLGDTSYPIRVFVDGRVTTGNANFNDFFFTLEPGATPQLVIGASVAEVFGDVAFDFEISLTIMDVLAPFVEITDGTAGGVLIGDRVDRTGGRAFGDPHLISFDNVAFDFQAAGEFVLTRATSGPAYEVQAKFVPISSAVSVTQAMATKIGEDKVSIEAGTDGGVLRVNDVVTSLANGASLMIGVGSISRVGNRIEIVNGNGDTTSVDVFSSFLNVTPEPASSRAAGSLQGLFGNKNGTPADDFRLANGTVLTTPIPTDVLYGAFAKSWSVKAVDRLLPGEAEAFQAPGRIVTVDSLPVAIREAAEAVVNAAGINNELIREAAILDFALTGNRDFIDAAVLTDQEFDPIVDTIAVDPVSSPVLLLTTDQIVLDEENAAGRTATLTVSRGSAEGALTVFYTLAGAGEAPASASDLVGGLASGSVTIAAGEEMATFTVAVASDDLAEGPETFDVSIAVGAADAEAYELLISSVRLTIEDSDEVSAGTVITGDSGNNVLPGTAGDDSIFGFAGNDQLAGAAGRDTLVGGAGNDMLWGGEGGDFFFFDTAEPSGVDIIQDFGFDDLLITTQAVRDRNGDGVIDFASNRLLDFGTKSTVRIVGESGSRVTQLEFDGIFEQNGVEYFVYSLVGSSAGVDTVIGFDPLLLAA